MKRSPRGKADPGTGSESAPADFGGQCQLKTTVSQGQDNSPHPSLQRGPHQALLNPPANHFPPSNSPHSTLFIFTTKCPLPEVPLQTQIHPSRPIADITPTTLSLGPSLCSQGLVRIPIDSVSPSRYPLPWLIPTTLRTRALLVSCAELAMAWRLSNACDPSVLASTLVPSGQPVPSVTAVVCFALSFRVEIPFKLQRSYGS